MDNVASSRLSGRRAEDAEPDADEDAEPDADEDAEPAADGVDVRRLLSARAWLLLGVAVHLHRFHGPPLDYSALAAAAFASWVGLPGPGEPLLIAAGVLSADGRLDLTETLLIAFVSATAGGVVGWLIGLKAGRAILERPGPFLSARLRALERGEEVFTRYPAISVLMTTSWIAGINRVATGTYMVWNTVGALLWTLGIGLGAYFAGPPIVDVVADLGWIPIAGIVLVVSLAVALEMIRRRRRRVAG